jgi:hypothetical protein
MTAATADREAKKHTERIRAYPVAAATTIYKGTGVAKDAAGNAISITDSAAVKFVGIAIEGVINTTAEGYGTAGDLRVRVDTRGVHAMVSSGLALTDQGADLYWADNQTVQTAPTNQYAGKLARYTSATEALVDIEPATCASPSGDDQDLIPLPVAALATIVVDTLVAYDGDGYLVPANDTAAVRFAGIAQEGVDNSAGADGALDCFVAQAGTFNLIGSGLAADDAGKEVYVSTATTVTLRPGRMLVGKLARYSSATVAPVDIGPGIALTGKMEIVGVAATKAVVAGDMVCKDADGYLVKASDATAVSFWGIAMDSRDNSAGADGALYCYVLRDALIGLTGSGLAATDVGKEVWQTTDTATVTTTPGTILVGVIEQVPTATTPVVRIKPLAEVGERIDRQFVILFAHSGATLNGKSARTDMEFPRRYLPLIMQFNLETAPGGTDTLTATLTDGTTTFAAVCTGAAVLGENKTPMVLTTETMKADTDTDVTLADTSTTSADCKGHVLCEAL